MLNQIISVTPQAAPAKTTSKGAETGNDAQAKTRSGDKPADTFGAVLTRQMDDKKTPATENPPAETAPLQPKKMTDAKSLRADPEKLTTPDDPSLVLAAILLANPESKPNVAQNLTGENPATNKTSTAQLKPKTDRPTVESGYCRRHKDWQSRTA